ncbi:MAG TPA: MarR family transcriptional regulator [Acidimicrobiales bacterium]|nr:MarR family transcriptional regulator [Acidimicrobiales bacterium]
MARARRGGESNGKRQRTPDTTLELAERLTHCARRLRLGSTAQLAPLGLTNAQARVLRIVAGAGQPLKMTDIASQLEVVPRSVTTMVDGVEAAGFIVRSTDPDDRRSVLVSLTSRGHALLERLERAGRVTAEEIFGGLTDGDRVELARLLEALCQHGDCRCSGAAHGGSGYGHPHQHQHQHAQLGDLEHGPTEHGHEHGGHGHRGDPGTGMPRSRRHEDEG